MKFFTIKTDASGSKKIMYPLDSIGKISNDINQEFESEHTKIILTDGSVLKVEESINDIYELLKNNDVNDDDLVFTGYINKKAIYNN
ncbi:MAG: hypothetical protein LBF27_25905 [Sphingobacterium sp.]|jgi:hypothetical protein|nr:hypothetical protein [Sphingobacterium sp.]